MKLDIPYGKEKIAFNIPDKNLIGKMDPLFVEPVDDVRKAILEAVENPIGSKKIEEIVVPGKSISVIIDDGSRATPISTILPILLPRLEAAGANTEDIRIVVALGSHRYMTEKEMEERVGTNIYKRYKVYNSEFRRPEGLVYVGDTPEGIPITASKVVTDTDIHIGVGSLVPHPVMGWGGGGKIIYPGIVGEQVVAYFHLKASLYDENFFGYDTTPVREMMEKWVDTIGLDFIINTILDSKFQIADVVAGNYVEAYKEGVRRGKKIVGFQVKERADVMIASSHPADQDFWQSPKALFSAEAGLKGDSGNTMILVSPNYEGIGPHEEYPKFMGRDDGDSIVKACIQGENHGDPLAIAVGNGMAKLRKRRRLIVVSDGVTKAEMDVCKCEHYPAKDLQKVLDQLIDENPLLRVGVLSNGAETFLYR